MIGQNRNCILAFNGEIYNAFEYRDFLRQKGYQFRGRSDTEVLLNLYEYFGFADMLDKLNGMFSVCIIDLKKNKIFMARDRLGIKPLYYYTTPDIVLFGSEVKAFLPNKEFMPILDESNLDEYTKYGYICGRETLLKDVYNVEPGEFIVLDKSGIKRRRYWDIYNEAETQRPTFPEACDQIQETLLKSLKLRLISDVKIGCQLSGGIDSSLITLFTDKYLKGYDLNAISILFEDKKYSEEPWIDSVIKNTNINAHKYTLTQERFFQNLESTVWYSDFPSAHPSCNGINLMSEKAKDYFTVMLSGEGSDELFTGYERFYGGAVLGNRLFLQIIKNSPHLRHYIYSQYLSLSPNKFDLVDWFITRSSYLGMAELRRLKPDFRMEKFMTHRREIFNAGVGDFVKKAQRYELKTWLVDCLMRQDKMTMANSIENRLPMIDHHLVDLVRRLPSTFFVRTTLSSRMGTKIILKKLAARHFGRKFAYRKKIGFNVPVREFFGYSRFQEYAFDTLIPGIKNRGLYDAEIVKSRLKCIHSLNNEKVQAIWFLINLEIWARLFLDKKKRIVE